MAEKRRLKCDMPSMVGAPREAVLFKILGGSGFLQSADCITQLAVNNRNNWRRSTGVTEIGKLGSQPNSFCLLLKPEPT
jgi:hypothetical protein